jgi:hypothetical protein
MLIGVHRRSSAAKWVVGKKGFHEFADTIFGPPMNADERR